MTAMPPPRRRSHASTSKPTACSGMSVGRSDCSDRGSRNVPFRYLDFVITGTPRSGTTYMASLLRELGFDCTHERCFDPWRIVFAEDRPDTSPWGDSSWLAVPYLGDLPTVTRVIHVVRDPVDSINSIIGTGQLDWPHDYRTFIAHHWHGDRDWWPRELTDPGERFWLDWNARIEASGRVDLRVQLEGVCDELDALFDVIDPHGTVEHPSSSDIARRVSPRTNTRPHLESCPLVARNDLDERTVALAREYGYDY